MPVSSAWPARASPTACKALVEVVAAKEYLARAVTRLVQARILALPGLGEQRLPMMACKASAMGISRVCRAGVAVTTVRVWRASVAGQTVPGFGGMLAALTRIPVLRSGSLDKARMGLKAS